MPSVAESAVDSVGWAAEAEDQESAVAEVGTDSDQEALDQDQDRGPGSGVRYGDRCSRYLYNVTLTFGPLAKTLGRFIA
jgi:hypothetical protein